MRVAIIGGGAGGFFTAINLAENSPDFEIVIFEKGKNVLGKVKVSGGGRCNVTHACFEPKELVKYYPRGQKELLGPFHKFMTGDTMEWFDSRGVELKIESDNRVFPISNDSQTIINCFMDLIQKHNIEVKTECGIDAFEPTENQWRISYAGKQELFDAVVVASGGNSSAIWNQLETLGYEIEPPIPSLFTFNTKDTRLRNLSGLSVPHAKVKIAGTKIAETGPVLVTHWGLSGPGILKLSAVGAKLLHSKDYQFSIIVDWCVDFETEKVLAAFDEQRKLHPKKKVLNTPLCNLPKRLWESFVNFCGISEEKIWAELGAKDQNKLMETLKNSMFQISGKSTNKEEFVTCGGVKLHQINFTKFESKLHPRLYFVGEVLNIDALTGGFNFQAAWTGGFIAAKSIVES